MKVSETRPETVNIWTLSLDLPLQRITELWNLLPADEKDRAEAVGAPRLRQRYVAAWGQVMQILGCVLNTTPEQVRLRREGLGRPEIAWPRTDLRFSLSHSDGLATLALVHGCHDIGIDVERIRPLAGWKHVAQRHFSPAERSEILRSPANRQHVAFLRIWTRKEAWLKAYGTGIVEDLNRLDTTEGVVPEHTARHPDFDTHYRLRAIMLGPGYVGTAAIPAEGPQIIQVHQLFARRETPHRLSA